MKLNLSNISNQLIMKNSITYAALSILIILLIFNAYFYFFIWKEHKAVLNCVTISITAGNPDNALKNFLSCTDGIYDE